MSDKINEAVNAISREYHNDIRDYAQEIRKDIIDGEYINDWDDVETRVHETADGSQWCIYTFKAKLVLLVSDNSDAASEYGIDLSSEGDFFSQMAFWAIKSDIEEQLEAEGVTQDALESIEELEDTGDIEEMKRKRAAILDGEDVE